MRCQMFTKNSLDAYTVWLSMPAALGVASLSKFEY